MSEWTPLSPGVLARCLLEERGTALMLYRMQPGLRFAPHQHSTAELGVVLSGEGRLLLGSEARPVRAGDTFFIGPGTSHGFETFVKGEEAVVLNAVCPTRLDDPRPLLEAIWGSGLAPISGRSADPDAGTARSAHRVRPSMTRRLRRRRVSAAELRRGTSGRAGREPPSPTTGHHPRPRPDR
ncbi:MAG: cupin domain-containing protein [Thermoplasmata archaeon]